MAVADPGALERETTKRAEGWKSSSGVQR